MMTLNEYRRILEDRIELRRKWAEGVYDENSLQCRGEIYAFEVVLKDLERLGDYVPKHERTEL